MSSSPITYASRVVVERRPSPQGEPAALTGADALRLLDLLPNPVLYVDREFRVHYANRSAQVFCPHREDSFAGARAWELLPELAEEKLAEMSHRVWATGSVEKSDFYFSAQNSWAEVAVSSFGEGILVVLQDVSARKRVEASRDAANKQLRQVLDATSDGIISVDPAWNITFCNERSKTLLGHSTELTGRGFWQEFPGLIGSGFEAPIRRTMTGRLPETFEAACSGPTMRWYAVASRALGDGLVLFFSDATERRTANRILLQQQALLSSIAEEVGLATFELDLETGQVQFGPGSQSVYGHPLEELTTVAAIERTLHPDCRGQIERNTHKAVALHQPFVSEYRTIGADGSIHWVEARGRASFNNGSPTHVRGIALSITARKQTEEARDLAASRLEQVLDATSDGVFSVDCSWTITFMNRQAKAVLHRDDGCIGKNLWQEFPEAVGGVSYHHYHRTMSERVPILFESTSAAITGRWLAIEARPSDEGIVVFFADMTERRQAEQAVRDQQALLATVQENARLATWEHDLTTGRITFGAGSHPIYGHPLKSLHDTESFISILHPDHRDQVEKDVHQAVVLRQPFVSDFRAIGTDGQVNWVESRGNATFQDGVATHLRGIAIDITERKRNEQALAASERRYRVLADLNPQALWAGAADGTVTYANQFYLDYIGRSAGDLIDWIACFDPEDRARVTEVWTRSVQTGIDYDIEARLIRAGDGASRWWHIRAAPVRDETGSITSWLGVSLDIHDAKHAAEALRLKQEETERQRAELETVYRTTPVGLALFDPVEFRFLRVNERGTEIMGMRENELIGRKLADLPHVTDVPEIFRQVAQGKAFRDLIIEGELPNRPGDRRIWNVNYFPVYGSTGKVDAIATASLDITNQKRSEAALIQSEKLAAVGRLASSISHEINNPLEAVTNLLYIIGTSPDLPPEIADYVQTAQAELSRVSQIATHTLRFHRQSVARTSVTAQELVDAVLSLYGGRLANSAIRVETRYATDCAVLCFENDIRQVLNNLIANAIDAMRTGGRLLVRAHSGISRQGLAGVRITLADTGHGMTEEVRQRIFEPFYTTKGLNGTGLGMWISAGIVERHQGSLRVRSKTSTVAHGTVFTLFLPCDAAHSASEVS